MWRTLEPRRLLRFFQAPPEQEIHRDDALNLIALLSLGWSAGVPLLARGADGPRHRRSRQALHLAKAVNAQRCIVLSHIVASAYWWGRNLEMLECITLLYEGSVVSELSKSFSIGVKVQGGFASKTSFSGPYGRPSRSQEIDRVLLLGEVLVQKPSNTESQRGYIDYPPHVRELRN